MATATITFQTAGQSFPSGTGDTQFKFTITGPTQTQVKYNTVPTVWFADLQAGGAYTCTCEKNGVMATHAFTVPAPNVTLQVPAAPASVSVS